MEERRATLGKAFHGPQHAESEEEADETEAGLLPPDEGEMAGFSPVVTLQFNVVNLPGELASVDLCQGDVKARNLAAVCLVMV